MKVQIPFLPPAEMARAYGRQSALEHMAKSCPNGIEWCLNHHSTNGARDHHTKLCNCFLAKKARSEPEEE